MLRARISRIIQSSCHVAVAPSEALSSNSGRALSSLSTLNIKNHPEGDVGDSRVIVLAALAATVAAAGLGPDSNSPAKTEAAAPGKNNAEEKGETASPDSRDDPVNPELPADDLDILRSTFRFDLADRMAKAEKEMSSGESPAPEKSLLERNLHLFGGSGDDDDEGGGDSRPKSEWDPMNLQESKDYAAKQLTEFRLLQAKEGNMCPTVDFREEKAGDGKTFSASFYLKPTANALRVFAAMLTPEHVFEMKQMTSDKKGASLAFCKQDRTGSLLFRHDESMGPMSVSAHMYQDGGFRRRDIDKLVQGYKAAWTKEEDKDLSGLGGRRPGFPGNLSRTMSPDSDQPSSGEAKLAALGVQVYSNVSADIPGWDALAGYTEVKQDIEDTLVMPLQYPETFDGITRKTRTHFEPTKARAVLFEGPPGTGKTLSARIVAGRADRPMVHVPVESIVSKWYGEAERKLGAIFDACNEMGGAIIFIDEVDALAGSRSSGEMHEATRRILSVILQKVEGFDDSSKCTLICATNRKADLDPALLSRIQLTVRFGLPDMKTRQGVFAMYAKQLSPHELKTLASISNGMSCRDIKGVCQHVERRWASKLIRKEETAELPGIEEYMTCVDSRREELAYGSGATET